MDIDINDFMEQSLSNENASMSLGETTIKSHAILSVFITEYDAGGTYAVQLKNSENLVVKAICKYNILHHNHKEIALTILLKELLWLSNEYYLEIYNVIPKELNSSFTTKSFEHNYCNTALDKDLTTLASILNELESLESISSMDRISKLLSIDPKGNLLDALDESREFFSYDSVAHEKDFVQYYRCAVEYRECDTVFYLELFDTAWPNSDPMTKREYQRVAPLGVVEGHNTTQMLSVQIKIYEFFLRISQNRSAYFIGINPRECTVPQPYTFDTNAALSINPHDVQKVEENCKYLRELQQLLNCNKYTEVKDLIQSRSIDTKAIEEGEVELYSYEMSRWGLIQHYTMYALQRDGKISVYLRKGHVNIDCDIIQYEKGDSLVGETNSDTYQTRLTIVELLLDFLAVTSKRALIQVRNVIPPLFSVYLPVSFPHENFYSYQPLSYKILRELGVYINIEKSRDFEINTVAIEIFDFIVTNSTSILPAENALEVCSLLIELFDSNIVLYSKRPIEDITLAMKHLISIDAIPEKMGALRCYSSNDKSYDFCDIKGINHQQVLFIVPNDQFLGGNIVRDRYSPRNTLFVDPLSKKNKILSLERFKEELDSYL